MAGIHLMLAGAAAQDAGPTLLSDVDLPFRYYETDSFYPYWQEGYSNQGGYTVYTGPNPGTLIGADYSGSWGHYIYFASALTGSPYYITWTLDNGTMYQAANLGGSSYGGRTTAAAAPFSTSGTHRLRAWASPNAFTSGTVDVTVGNSGTTYYGYLPAVSIGSKSNESGLDLKGLYYLNSGTPKYTYAIIWPTVETSLPSTIYITKSGGGAQTFTRLQGWTYRLANDVFSLTGATGNTYGFTVSA